MANIINIVDEFKKQLGGVPSDAKDINMICSMIYGEYKVRLAVVKALVMPISTMQTLIRGAVTALDDFSYNTIMDNLSHLNTGLKDILPDIFEKDMVIDVDTVNMAKLLSITCTDFFNSVPESLFNMIQDIDYNLVDPFENLINLPKSLAYDIVFQLIQFKNDALREAMGALWEPIIQPFIEYEEFIRSCGVDMQISRMAAIERCMMKPGICDKPRSYFVNPANRKLWSRHFRDEFMLDNRGNLRLKKLIPDDRDQLRRVNKMLQNLSSFRLTVKK